MTINDREIIFVKYSTEESWKENIPHSNWLCVLVDHYSKQACLEEVVSKIIHNHACYVCIVGRSCERTHDFIDEEIARKEVGVEQVALQKHHIVTTFHNDFDEGIRFALFVAQHEKSPINRVVVLDMTDGGELNRIKKLIMKS